MAPNASAASRRGFLWYHVYRCMRRILLLITDLELGGMPTIVREVAIRLSRGEGVHVEVACLSPWGPVADQLRDAGINVTALGARSAIDVRVFPRLIRLIRDGRFDVVLSCLVHANVAAAAASMFCHGVRFFQCIQTTQPRPRWHWTAQAVAQHGAEKIFVPSKSVAQVMRDWSMVPGEKIVLIPNGVEPALFERSTVPQTDPRPYPIGFIGRLDPIKCIPDLLEAMRQLAHPAHLNIYGQGEDRERIEREIARLGIEAQVTLHGPIARPQEALRRIGLLVLPSEAEGFGIVLIEAMAAGVPVVATNVAGIRDVVRDGETGLLVPPHNPPALARAIDRIVADVVLRQRMIASGLEDVQRRFAWDSIIARYREELVVRG